jgi:hypothetical protein
MEVRTPFPKVSTPVMPTAATYDRKDHLPKSMLTLAKAMMVMVVVVAPQPRHSKLPVSPLGLNG